MCRAGMRQGVLSLCLWCVSSGVTPGDVHHSHRSLVLSLFVCVCVYFRAIWSGSVSLSVLAKGH